MTNSTSFGRLNKNKQFRLPLPNDVRTIHYSKFNVIFMDKDNQIASRECTYRTNELHEIVIELKTIYKEVIVLDEKDGIAQIQVKLNDGDTVQDSFDKFRSTKR
jgi:hypothetical protein